MRTAVVAVSFAALAIAQDVRINTQSRLVVVPVNVTDIHGRYVEDLEAHEFTILDNGRAQHATVDTFDTGVAPIALIVAVQSSGISTAVLEKVRKIGAMIQPLVAGARGCAGLVSFAESVRWLQDCTHDQDQFTRAFDQLRPGERKKAVLLDAVGDVVARLNKRPNSRRVLLLISELRDRGSKSTLLDVTVAAQTAGIAIYAATFSNFKTAFTSQSSPNGLPAGPKHTRLPSEDTRTVNGMPSGAYNPPTVPPEQTVDLLGLAGEIRHLHKPVSAQVLAAATGGLTLPFTRQKALEDAIQRLGEELHSQYVLSFVPDAPEPGYHRLDVRVNRPGEYRVHARPGYWPPE